MSAKAKKPAPKKGPDTSKVKLDDAGRFQLDDKQLGKVAGGLMASGKPKQIPSCGPSVTPNGCIVKVGTKCR